MFKSITTPDVEFNLNMHLVERIIIAEKPKAPPFFWSKKKCSRFDADIYYHVQKLIPIFKRTEKLYGAEVLLATFKKFDKKQLRKIYKLSYSYKTVGQIYSGLCWYCQDEVNRFARLAKKKDSGEAERINFKVKGDLRPPELKLTHTKNNLWNILCEGAA